VTDKIRRDLLRQRLRPPPHRGILRDVWLEALPLDHISQVHVETDWDPGYLDATLKIAAGATLRTAESGRLSFALLDRDAGASDSRRPRWT